MTAQDIVEQLKPLGAESYKNTLQKHGAREPILGVKIEELKKIQKKVKKDYQLALDLFDTGIYDAMYLAGLIADDMKMSKRDLQHWVAKANCPTISEYTVAWVAAEGPHGHALALEWIASQKENIASTGWATLGCLVALKDDASLDTEELQHLLQRIQKNIHQQPSRVRHTMNGFVIATACHVAGLKELALQVGDQIGSSSADRGDGASKLLNVREAVLKVEKRGALGKKKKTVKC